jgi:hypothetical protein
MERQVTPARGSTLVVVFWLAGDTEGVFCDGRDTAA